MIELEYAGRYRCDTCGETQPLMLWPAMSKVVRAIGGLHAPKFVSHGPGCMGQEWDLIDESGRALVTAAEFRLLSPLGGVVTMGDPSDLECE